MLSPRNTAATPALLKAALCAVSAALLWVGCEDQVAGTSVGTGNPTEIQVSFRDDSDMAVAVTGTLDVYASTQIPVSGYRPAPLISIPLASVNRASIKVAAFKALADSLWPKGSQDNGKYLFNLVVKGDTRGAVLRGFSFRKSNSDFLLRVEDGKVSVDAGGAAAIKGAVHPMVAFGGTVDTTTFSEVLDYHIFLYGTGFTAKIEHGSFSLPKMPDGNYDAFLLPLPHKDQQTSGNDSTVVFSTTASLSAGSSTVGRGAVHDRVRLPDSLIVP